MFLQRIIYKPAFGKSSELGAVLYEYVEMNEGQGRSYGLHRQLFTSDGPTYVLCRIFEDLAAYQHSRHTQASDPTYREYLQKIQAVTDTPPRNEMFEMVVGLTT